MKTSTGDAPPSSRSPDDAWAINRLLMNWMAPIAWRGFRRPLTQDDLPGIPRPLEMADIAERTRVLWAAERKKERARKAAEGPVKPGGRGRKGRPEDS